MNATTFFRLVEKHGLLSKSELKSLRASQNVDDSDAKPIAEDLVRSGRLSKWQAGRLLAGKGGFRLGSYRLTDKIAVGGMGVVLKATRPPSGEPVAIKVLSKAMLEKPQARRRFEREIDAALRLRHPNIVESIETGEVDDVPFLVMEYVDGCTLSQAVRSQGALPMPIACEIALRAALGLQHAAEHGIVHRDVKPANILLSRVAGSRRLRVQVSDFGLARLAEQEDAELTELTGATQVFGTVDFMSPEQAISARSADTRSDIYSLAATLFYTLTGRPVFLGETPTEKLSQKVRGDVPLIRTIRPDLPRSLETLLITALAVDPDKRPQEPVEFADQLRPFANGKVPRELETQGVLQDDADDEGEQIQAFEQFLSGVEEQESRTEPVSQRRTRNKSLPPAAVLGVVALLMTLITWGVVANSGSEDLPAPVRNSRLPAWPGPSPSELFRWQAGEEPSHLLQFQPGVQFDGRGRLVFDGGVVRVPDVAEAAPQACRQSDQVTLELVFTAADAAGPQRAHLLTLSPGPGRCNLAISQEGDQLVLRLRTPVTGQNGDDPSVLLTDVRAGEPTHLVVTYESDRVSCFVDGVRVLVSRDIRGGLRNWEPFPLLIGGDADGGAAWRGTIERILITADRLSDAEARDHYQMVKADRVAAKN